MGASLLYFRVETCFVPGTRGCWDETHLKARFLAPFRKNKGHDIIRCDLFTACVFFLNINIYIKEAHVSLLALARNITTH